MKGHIYTLLALSALFAISCNKETEEQAKPAELTLSVAPSQLNFSSQSETKNLTVKTNASTVEISDNLSWLVIEKSTTGFKVEALENSQIEAREGILTVFAIEGNDKKTADIKVIQSGAGAKAQFEDEEFRRLMLEACDRDADGTISQEEADMVTELDLAYDEESTDRSTITSLDGIKIFRNLKNLECDFNAITSLDLSGMENLEYVNCSYNKINSLNLSGCKNLMQVYANVNELTSLDLSGCDNIKFVQAYKNKITSFELTDKAELGYIDISQNELTTIKVSGCPKLGILNCGSNKLAKLELSNLPHLYSLGCYNNNLTELPIKDFPELLMVECYDNNLRDLDLSECPTLGSIKCSNNILETLSLPSIKKELVTYVVCSGNKLKELDITMYPEIKQLECNANFLESLKVDGCSKLETLSADSNKLSELSLTGLSSLKTFTCKDNSLKELNITECAALELVDARENPLNVLWVTEEQHTSIKEIKTDDNDNIVKVYSPVPAVPFTVELTKVWYESAEFKVTPSDKNATYIAYTRAKSKVDSFASDEALIADDIKRFTEWSTLEASGSFYTGEQTIGSNCSRWTAKDYYVVVYGLTADGKQTSDEVIKIPFTLSASKPTISVDSIEEIPSNGGTFTVNYTIDNEREGEAVTVESMNGSWLHINNVDTAAHTITFTVDECTQISYYYPYKRDGSFIVYHADADPYSVDFKQKCPTSSN